MPCSASRFVSMYLDGTMGREKSSADMNTNGLGLGYALPSPDWIKASHTRSAVKQRDSQIETSVDMSSTRTRIPIEPLIATLSLFLGEGVAPIDVLGDGVEESSD